VSVSRTQNASAHRGQLFIRAEPALTKPGDPGDPGDPGGPGGGGSGGGPTNGRALNETTVSVSRTQNASTHHGRLFIRAK
jgi:hypothetical protein